MDGARRSHNPWPDLDDAHVFVIEDNIDTRILLSDVLGHCGARVTSFDSAEAALEGLNDSLPSVVVCDLAMPGIDGLQFVRRLRARPAEQGGTLPAVALTAFYEEFAAPAARNAGYTAYLMKPVRIEVLCQLVNDLARPDDQGSISAV
jgi:CheY-like chemotaxis protein